MDSYVKALLIFLTSLAINIVKCSTLGSCGESELSAAKAFHQATFDRFEVSQWGTAEHLVKLISCKYDDPSLFVVILNSMAGAKGTATISSDCYAYSNSGQLLSSLGEGPIEPTSTTIYWMNLKYFIPTMGKVSCNVTASGGNSRIFTMYHDNNMELSYLTIQWSIEERGFSLYNSVSDNFDLYATW